MDHSERKFSINLRQLHDPETITVDAILFILNDSLFFFCS